MNIRISTKGKRPLRSLTPSDKIHAIQRIHDGESKASVARDIGVPESTLRGWCKNEDKLRFMSRQSSADKLTSDGMGDKLDCSSGGLLGPPEKRQRLDSTHPLNFSNKMKLDELTFKRSSLNGLDYSTNKALTDLNYNGMHPDYAAFNGVVKNKVFGADISRPTDPAIAAISPLSSLSHLSGLTGISQSPLAISFNELTSNLNLLAQLNPGLAAMSGLNSFAASANTMRTSQKPQKTPAAQIQSPRSESGERIQGLSVKNWAKQKPTTSTDAGGCGLNLSQNELKPDMKSPNLSIPTQLVGSVPPLPGLPDDPLLYWIKSQQNMLGLNALYPPPVALGANSPPIRSSTPQQQHSQHHNHLSSTPPTPMASAAIAPISTPSALSLDDKNNAWFNWCKAFSASLHSLTPNAASSLASLQANSMHQHATSTTAESSCNVADLNKASYENILYSHLTKDSNSPSVQSSSSNDNLNNNEVTSNTDCGKPEDLSAKLVKVSSPACSPIHGHAESPSPAHSQQHSPVIQSEADTATDVLESVADCKDVLENILYKINNNPNTLMDRDALTPVNADLGNESDESYNSEHHHNNNDVSASNNNNNNNSNKTDEEERARCAEYATDIDDDDVEAIKHGEKFLQWLENCSNPRVTALQLMQLRFLIAAIKSGNESKVSNNNKSCISSSNANLSDNEDNNVHEIEVSSRNKGRRRK